MSPAEKVRFPGAVFSVGKTSNSDSSVLFELQAVLSLVRETEPNNITTGKVILNILNGKLKNWRDFERKKEDKPTAMNQSENRNESRNVL